VVAVSQRAQSACRVGQSRAADEDDHEHIGQAGDDLIDDLGKDEQVMTYVSQRAPAA
jgi:hypothetical protein